MTPDQLLTFACVADTGNISRAAQTLHLSQPAVSGQLRMLQEWFGEPLYRRSGHGIALTEAGERLAEQARQLRQVYRQAQAVRESWRGLERACCAWAPAPRRPATCCRDWWPNSGRRFRP